MNILKQIYPAVMITIVLTVLLGIIYPLVVTGLAQVIFPTQAAGSLIIKDGKVVGSSLIGQPFSGLGYFHSRPSAAGSGYDAAASSGTNLGPTSQKLLEINVKPAADALREENPNTPIPIDMVTSSGSGLDPHITPAAAEFQIPRIVKERGMSEAEVRRLVREHSEGRQFGFLGEARVNVLELNLALDRMTSGK
jgi:K+-transporting ATPase ATPase C chain